MRELEKGKPGESGKPVWFWRWVVWKMGFMGKRCWTWGCDPATATAGEQLIMPASSDSASSPGFSETGELFFNGWREDTCQTQGFQPSPERSGMGQRTIFVGFMIYFKDEKKGSGNWDLTSAVSLNAGMSSSGTPCANLHHCLCRKSEMNACGGEMDSKSRWRMTFGSPEGLMALTGKQRGVINRRANDWITSHSAKK